MTSTTEEEDGTNNTITAVQKQLTRYGGKLCPFDDGHIPELFKEKKQTSQILQYPSRQASCTDNHASTNYPPPKEQLDTFVNIYNCALPTDLTHAIYDVTTSSHTHNRAQKHANTINSNNNITTAQKGKNQSQTWGTYVTFLEAKQYLEHECATGKRRDEKWQYLSRNKIQEDQNIDLENYQKDLAVAAVAHYFFETILQETGEEFKSIHTLLNQSLDETRNNDNDQNGLHGVGVWALPSQPRTQVPFHIDYAEWVRYKYNIVVPPIYAGTIQCTDATHVRGGEFAVHMDGMCRSSMDSTSNNIEEKNDGHSIYLDVGYKGYKSKDCMGGWARPSIDFLHSRDDPNCNDMSQRKCCQLKKHGENEKIATHDRNLKKKRGCYHKDGNRWITIPYRFNQGIFHSGQLPHLSGSVEQFESIDQCEHGSIQTQKQRVIMGFNVFQNDVGPLVQAVPEHSSVFRQKVSDERRRLQQKQQLSNKKGPLQGLSLEKLMEHKELGKALVLAKREKIKREWQYCQSIMTDFLVDTLMKSQHVQQHDFLHLEEILERWRDFCEEKKEETENNSIHLTPNDVYVHIQHLVTTKYTCKNFTIVAFDAPFDGKKIENSAEILTGNCAIGLREIVN